MSPLLIVGLAAVFAALVIGAAVFLVPRRPSRKAAGAALVDRLLGDGTRRAGFEDRLELAGVTTPASAVILRVVIVAALALIAGAGLAVLRPSVFALLLPIGLVAFVLLGARFLLERRTEKRRAAFADQLDDTLSLVASGLRAGHSLPRAMDAVSHEAESPTAEEFARILNQNRLGRDLGEALQLSAERMRSDDLAWVAQAVAIHREVGGNLSEVLDHVGETIRERNQIRRQVATLSAEGRMSANVLIALPVLIAVVLAVMSPGYLLGFLTTPLGWLMIAASLVLFAIGVIWLRAVVRVTF
jgi:tight adherence protein B